MTGKGETLGNEVVLAHGGGGRLSLELIETEILTRFGEGPLAGLPDGATLDMTAGRLVVSTDSFVVQPLEFPGGNIGDLAVYGTVNDVAVAGGRPCYLSLALILEEGLAMETLRRVLDSVRSAADRCEVKVATGDIKVVPRGQCDGMYINTTGLGEAVEGFDLGPDRILPGDRVLVSGTLGDHGMAVMAARESIGIKNGPASDAGPVHRLVKALTDLGPSVRFLRDPTRGGVSAVLNEVTRGRTFGIEVREADLPFSAAGRAVAEMLGMDLLHSACEGRVLLICHPDAADAVVDRWRGLPEGRDAAVVGTVTEEAGRVTMETVIGSRRLVDMPRGELLPRIC
jgi:hydrogenase expression/formation protein HypE